MIEVTLIARFDNEEVARAALSDMEEAVGRHDGEVYDYTVNNEEEESS